MLCGAAKGQLDILEGAFANCNIVSVHDRNDYGETALHLASKHFYTAGYHLITRHSKAARRGILISIWHKHFFDSAKWTTHTQ